MSLVNKGGKCHIPPFYSNLMCGVEKDVAKMVLSETIKMKWNGRNKAYYTSKGYEWTKQGDEFDVKIEDLNPTSHNKISVACDECGKIGNPSYRDYVNRKYDEYLCSDCACRKYGSKTRIRRYVENKSISFGNWFEENVSKDFIKDYWNKELNKNIDPYLIPYASNKEIYINCTNKDHPSYLTTCDRYSLRGQRCPMCADEQEESRLQSKVKNYLESLFGANDITHEFNCSILPVNPKTGARLRYDNCIESIKLIIEVNGGQHYMITSWCNIVAKKKGITPEEEFAYQQWKDEYKKQYALSHGYEYLAIPYWTEKDESYKQLIDDKIAEINNKLKCKGDTL